MSRRGVPGALRRLVRQPLVASAVALLGVTVLAAAGVGSAAAAVLRAGLDENWRGAYDILVTPVDAFAPIDGMLPPNTLASTESGLSLDDLARIRAVDGVEIAAPIGEVAVPGLKMSSVHVIVPKGLPGADVEPQAFRVTMTYSTDDGLGERVVWRDEIPLIVDEAAATRPPPTVDEPECDDPDQPSGYNGHEYRQGDYPALTAFFCSNRQTAVENRVASPRGGGAMSFWDDRWGEGRLAGYPVSLPANPLSTTRITLIDPVAERALLGAAGAFLDPLVSAAPSAETDVGSLTRWAEQSGDEATTERLRSLREQTSGYPGMPDDALADLRRLYAADGDDYDAEQAEMTTGADAAPLLIAGDATASLTVTVDVEAFGAARADSDDPFPTYDLPTALEDGEAGVPVGSSRADASGALNPFRNDGAFVAWPGSEVPEGTAQAGWLGHLYLSALGSVAASDHSVRNGGIALSPWGYKSGAVEGDGTYNYFETSETGDRVGDEAAYTRAEEVWSGRNFGSVLALPIGEYAAPADLATDVDADYVPLGAYDVVGSTVTTGEYAGREMLPSVSGLGLVSSRTAAIGSLASAAKWEDETPIDAVRVRVGGIAGYTPDAQAEVLRIAAELRSRGFTVTVMAGSSPVDVPVAVAGYAFGTTDADGTQTVGELGEVTQRWSELGAVTRADESVSAATTWVLMIATVSAIVLLGAAQVAGIPGRREQARIMREIGFTRTRIARWYAAEEVPAVVLLALVGALAIGIAVDRRVVAFALSIAAGAVIVAATVSVVAGSRSRAATGRSSARSGGLGARSVTAFGVRQVALHPLVSVIHVLSIVFVGVAASATLAVIVTGQQSAGTSSLSELVRAQLFLPQALLGAVGLAGGLLLALLTRRIATARRAEQWSLLRAAGWTSRHLVRAQWAEGATVIVPSTVVSAVIAWVTAEAFGMQPAALFAAVAGGAAALIGTAVFTDRWKGHRT